MADAGMMQVRDAPEQPEEADECIGHRFAADDVASAAQEAEAGEEDDDDDQTKPPSGRHWREDKVDWALTMQSTVSESDPFPEIPKTFLDPKRVAKIVRGSQEVVGSWRRGGRSRNGSAPTVPGK